MEAIEVKPGSKENTQVIQPVIKESFSETSNVSKADASLTAKQQMINNIKSDLAIDNQTHETGEFLTNFTDTKMLTLDPTSIAKDFPYNITPDILTQSGDLIVFLALDDNGVVNAPDESEDTSLLNEGTIVALQELASTGKELLSDFEKNQNKIQTQVPALHVTIKGENNFAGVTNEDDFNFSTFEFNRSRKIHMEEISTKDTPIFSDNPEITTIMYGTRNIELNFRNSYKGDTLTEISNSEPISKHLNDHRSKMQFVESEEIPFLNEGTDIALQEFSSTENDLLTNFETKQNLILTELPTLQRSQKHESNFTDLTSEVHFNVPTFTFNHSRENEQQKIATTKPKSNVSDIAGIISDTFETLNTKLDSFQHIKPDESSNIGPKLPKCPDPGLCIFWFLAQDLCAEDSHCHGALICCMWGCSKICVDGENVLS